MGNLLLYGFESDCSSLNYLIIDPLESYVLSELQRKMSEAFRVFLIGDDDSLRSLPLRRYERMLKADPKECLPGYAGKRVRYALVVLELVNRKPEKIIQTQYSYLSFDAEGKIDFTEFEKQARLVMEVVGSLDSKQKHGRIIFVGHRFARKRFQDLYRWTPNPELEAAIVEAALGKA